MHTPGLAPLIVNAEGLSLVEEDRVTSAQALMDPETGLQDPPPSGGWGRLPWGGLPGFMTASDWLPPPRREVLLQMGLGELQTGEPLQSVTSDFIVFEVVDGKWVMQPSGLQMETGGPALGPADRIQEDFSHLEHHTCLITPENIQWIHAILNPPGLDLRGGGELATVLGEWGDGLSSGTQVFSPPDRLTLADSRRDRCSSPLDRAGWALLHWYEQGLAGGPILPACTWCGHPATSGCDTCATRGAGSTLPLTKCLDCAADEALKGCRNCTEMPPASNLHFSGGAQGGGPFPPRVPGAANLSQCGSLCSRGPCTEPCNRESWHPITECACEGHMLDMDAGLFAEHIKECLIMEGIASAGITNYDIGMTATRILKDLAEGNRAQGLDET